MRVTARRIGDGQALRDAMKDYNDGEGITLQRLRDKTVELDPAGRGVGRSMIGFLTAPSSAGVSGSGTGRSARFRETTSPATADLLEEALNVRPGQLFSREEVPDWTGR